MAFLYSELKGFSLKDLQEESKINIFFTFLGFLGISIILATYIFQVHHWISKRKFRGLDKRFFIARYIGFVLIALYAYQVKNVSHTTLGIWLSLTLIIYFFVL